ncbi:MAG: sortase [Lachnospiraceae bacterium]|nr:sortase [Lachnospiraceae bacterium]
MFSTLPSYIPVEDEAYYERGGVVFTPEYAVGRIDCVLEIPRISLKRCVYSGTDAEIEKDLDMWFTVSASGSLVPGKTHYAIFGHNHTVQNLSFNRLAEVSPGDYFTLTRGDTVYIYLVTDLLAMERNAGRTAYAYDDSVDPALCYIFTCGRDYMLLDGVSTRYKDFIVEGTLWKQVPIRIWRGEEETEEPARPRTTETQEPAAASHLSALRQELENAQEELRGMENAPVLTAASGEGSVPNRRSGRAGSFSWSMILLILTAVFSGGSLLLFLSAGICKIAEKEPRSGERGSSGSSFQITS